MKPEQGCPSGLMQAEQMATVGLMTAGIIHEINNLSNGVGMAEVRAAQEKM